MMRSSKYKYALSVLILPVVTLLGAACDSTAVTQTPSASTPHVLSAPTFGAAAGFSILAGTEVVNTGSSVIAGNLGVSPGSEVMGFLPGILSDESTHAADDAAFNAQTDAAAAYDSLSKESCDYVVTQSEWGSATVTPGVYCFSSSAQLTGTLTLDAQGKSDAIFIFPNRWHIDDRK